MKRLLAILLAALLLSGCGDATGGETETDGGGLTVEESSDAAAVAVTSPNHTVTKGMMTYFFNSSWQPYYENAASYGIDMTVSLKEQECAIGEGTWYDYFMEETRTYVQELLALCEAAAADGVSLEAGELAAVEYSMEELAASVTVAEGDAMDDALTAMYGSPVREADVRDALALMALGSKYASLFAESRGYTAEDIDDYYESHREEFDKVDVLAFTVTLGDFGYDASGDETAGEESPVTLREAETALFSWLERFEAAESDDAYRALAKEYLMEVRGRSERSAEESVRYLLIRGALADDYLLGGGVSDWAFGASQGETMAYTDSGSSYEVYRVVTATYRDERETRDVRHILLDYDSFDPEDLTKAAAEAEAAAEAAWAEWEQAGFTEAAFEELCARLSGDAETAARGGLMENVIPGSMPQDFDGWVFDEGRVEGDRGIIQSSYGYHVMLYAGAGALSVWQTEAAAAMLERDYNGVIDDHGQRIVFADDVIAGIEA